MERYPSGSRGHIANVLVGQKPSAGSNPVLSVLNKTTEVQSNSRTRRVPSVCHLSISKITIPHSIKLK